MLWRLHGCVRLGPFVETLSHTNVLTKCNSPTVMFEPSLPGGGRYVWEKGREGAGEGDRVMCVGREGRGEEGGGCSGVLWCAVCVDIVSVVFMCVWCVICVMIVCACVRVTEEGLRLKPLRAFP